MNSARAKAGLRCLFLADDHPITPYPTGGGPALIHNHLELLHHAGIDLALALLEQPAYSHGFREYRQTHPECWSKVRGWLSRDPLVAGAGPLRFPDRWRRPLIAWNDPGRLIYGDVDGAQRAALSSLIADYAPDFIWAELLHPAVVARGVAGRVPIVYGHQDWFWQITALMGRNLGRTLLAYHVWLRKRLEERLVREALGCVSGSATESAQITRLGGCHVAYLPPFSAPVDEEGLPSAGERPRVVQFGGMKTAANRIGVARFLQVAWPVVLQAENPPPELWVIGPMEDASGSLRRLLDGAGAICPGYVEDMPAVLRPDDIHVIPWEHDTGTRTRVPVALNYRQALLSTRAAVACLPELTHGKDAWLVDDLEAMGHAIVKLFRDDSLRQKLARAGRKTLLSTFTREAVQPRFDRFIEEIRVDLPSRSPGASAR